MGKADTGVNCCQSVWVRKFTSAAEELSLLNARHHSAAFPGKIAGFVQFIKSEKSRRLPLQLGGGKSRTAVGEGGGRRHTFTHAAEFDEKVNLLLHRAKKMGKLL